MAAKMRPEIRVVTKEPIAGITGLSARADLVKANITSEATPSATKSAPGTEVVS